MRRLASCIFSAILRRRPMTLIGLLVVALRRRRAAGRCGARPAAARPGRRRGRRGGCGRPGRCRARAAGRCRARARGGARRARRCGLLAGGAGRRAGARRRRRARPRRAGAGAARGAAALRLAALPSALRGAARRAGAGGAPASRVARAFDLDAGSAPRRPRSARRPRRRARRTLPATGDCISTVALSVIMSASCWSSSTVSPTLTCQATISASAMPSPMSGSLIT